MKEDENSNARDPLRGRLPGVVVEAQGQQMRGREHDLARAGDLHRTRAHAHARAHIHASTHARTHAPGQQAAVRT